MVAVTNGRVRDKGMRLVTIATSGVGLLRTELVLWLGWEGQVRGGAHTDDGDFRNRGRCT